MLELKDALETATDERDRVHEMNTYLSEQNTKLKEESATLITGIQSLKDSNMMLQVSENLSDGQNYFNFYCGPAQLTTDRCCSFLRAVCLYRFSASKRT